MIFNQFAQLMGVRRNQAGEGGEGGGGSVQAQPAQSAAGFDVDAFRRETANQINGAVARLERMWKQAQPQAAGTAETRTEEAPAAEPNAPAKETAQERELRRRLEAMQKRMDESESANKAAQAQALEEKRKAAIQSAVAKAGLADWAVEDAERLLLASIAWDDGELVDTKSKQPLADFVTEKVKTRKHWLPALQTGPGAQIPGDAGSAGAVDWTKINAKSTAADRENVLAQIRAAAETLKPSF